VAVTKKASAQKNGEGGLRATPECNKKAGQKGGRKAADAWRMGAKRGDRNVSEKLSGARYKSCRKKYQPPTNAPQTL